jgi:hypothetical protein
MLDRADGARGHDVPHLLEAGDVAVGQVDHVDDAGGLGRLGHLEGLGGVGRERLFAKDVLAGSDHRHRRRVMERIRRDVGHGIELAPLQGRLERGEPLGNGMGVGEGGELAGVDLDGADDLDAFDLAPPLLHLQRGHAAGAQDQETHGRSSPYLFAEPSAHWIALDCSWLLSLAPRSVIGSRAFSTGWLCAFISPE